VGGGAAVAEPLAPLAWGASAAACVMEGEAVEVCTGAPDGTEVHWVCRAGMGTARCTGGVAFVPAEVTRAEGCGLLHVRVGGPGAGAVTVAVVEPRYAGVRDELCALAERSEDTKNGAIVRDRVVPTLSWLLEAHYLGALSDESEHESAALAVRTLLTVAAQQSMPALRECLLELCTELREECGFDARPWEARASRGELTAWSALGGFRARALEPSYLRWHSSASMTREFAVNVVTRDAFFILCSFVDHVYVERDFRAFRAGSGEAWWWRPEDTDGLQSFLRLCIAVRSVFVFAKLAVEVGRYRAGRMDLEHGDPWRIMLCTCMMQLLSPVMQSWRSEKIMAALYVGQVIAIVVAGLPFRRVLLGHAVLLAGSLISMFATLHRLKIANAGAGLGLSAEASLAATIATTHCATLALSYATERHKRQLFIRKVSASAKEASARDAGAGSTA